MLRLPRAAHYSICESLCARDTANLIETASQWSRKDDPRHAAMRACLVDRVARARAVAARGLGTTGYVVPGKTIASMLEFLDAVERRDWEITPTGRDGNCNGQLEKILRSYTTSFSGGLKDGDDIVFPPGEYRLVRTVMLHNYSGGVQRIPQIHLRGVGGPYKTLLYADGFGYNHQDCLFRIRRDQLNYSGPKNLVIRFSGLVFSIYNINVKDYSAGIRVPSKEGCVVVGHHPTKMEDHDGQYIWYDPLRTRSWLFEYRPACPKKCSWKGTRSDDVGKHLITCPYHSRAL